MTIINCDMGECLSPDPDEVIMPLIDVANIACGGHAGNESSMKKTVELAKQYKVKIAAHPSYPDKENFGRISQNYDSDSLFLILQDQVAQLMTICQQCGVTMDYLKPHGALYHDMLKDPLTMDVICKVINAFDTDLSLIVQAGGSDADHVARLSRLYTVNLVEEAFADRRYQGKRLLPRSEPGALIDNVDEIITQYQSFSVTSTFNVDTVCFHSDHPPSVEALQRLKVS